MTCKGCSIEFQPRRSWQKFHNETSSKKWWSREIGASDTTLYNLPTGTVGAISELVVAIDLMRKGFEVFRAVSQSCSCDLLATKNGKQYTIEVRSGGILKSGKPWYSKKNIKAEYLAIVVNKFNKIIYLPELAETGKPYTYHRRPQTLI